MKEASRPKIIGVKHKKAPPPQGTIETISSDSTNNKKDDNGQQQFQPKPFLHTDSRIIHMRDFCSERKRIS
ncbi:hypothetical protein Anas_00124 [Armadillidium nasatum]|uniref:Uncharacterized protein n=1 Tax=Armadillidium nasatum TaxID=96803 RepID=A0A5N5TLG3_9CRUS|nr:hypothetical protein Anas_00124 [Armadillidium nasatum]